MTKLLRNAVQTEVMKEIKQQNKDFDMCHDTLTLLGFYCT